MRMESEAILCAFHKSVHPYTRFEHACVQSIALHVRSVCSLILLEHAQISITQFRQIMGSKADDFIGDSAFLL